MKVRRRRTHRKRGKCNTKSEEKARMGREKKKVKDIVKRREVSL